MDFAAIQMHSGLVELIRLDFWTLKEIRCFLDSGLCIFLDSDGTKVFSGLWCFHAFWTLVFACFLDSGVCMFLDSGVCKFLGL